MIRLIIARHGNTFGAGDTPTRVGKHTDLPLVEKGFAQGHALGRNLKDHNIIPTKIYCSTLQRTQQTAQKALDAMASPRPLIQSDIFDEVDYGPDENQTEETVIARIGKDAIENWDKRAIVPDGWNINPDEIIHNWISFAEELKNSANREQTILIITSNGIARFAPYVTGNFSKFSQEHTIKLSTGAYGIIDLEQGEWRVTEWNTRPVLNK